MTADPTAMPAAPDPADVAVEALHLRIAELEARESEHERSARIQRALYRIAEAATDSDDLPAFYATIHGIVGELMYAANFYIALYDAERRLLNYPYAVDSIDQTFPDPAVWELLGDEQARGITAYALRRGEPLFVGDRTTFEALVAAGEVEQIGPVEPDSQWLGAPLLSQGRILGLIAVQTYTAEHRLGREDLDVLAFVGRHIGAALTRVRANEEIRARNAELTLINEIGAALSSQLDFAGIIELVGERVRSIFDSKTAFVGLYDEATDSMTFPYDIDEGERFDRGVIQLGRGLTTTVVRTAGPVRLGSREAQFAAGAIDIGGTTTLSWLGVPILAGERVIGIVGLESVEADAYSEADERLLSTVAASMGVALENARLFGETKRLLAETDERAAELSVINEIGDALARQLDFDAIIDLVGNRISGMFDAHSMFIALYDQATNVIEYPFDLVEGRRQHNDSLTLG